MNQNNKWWTSNYIVGLIAITGIITVGFLSLNKLHDSSINFSLHYNVFAIVSFFSVLIDLATIGLFIIKKRYSITTGWFLLFLIAATVMAIAEGLQRSSVFVSGALFWQNLFFVGLALLPIAFYLFIISYAADYKRQLIFLASVLIMIWGIVVFFSGLGIFYSKNLVDIYNTSYGFYSKNTPIQSLAVSWFSLFYFLGTAILIQLRRKTENKLIKRQIAIFLITFLLPYFAAIFSHTVMPNIIPSSIPPLATLVGAFSGLILYFGIYRYRLFEVDPQVLAQNILDTMNEAVIITRTDLTIESINYEAERLLGIKSKLASNQKLENFFMGRTWELIFSKLTNLPSEADGLANTRNFVKNVNGIFIPVRISATSLIISGEKLANVLVLTDISEITKSFVALQNSSAKILQQNEQLVKLESQLREEKAGVEKVVETRTWELMSAQNKLKEGDKLKTEFIMLTSHNLRTPLAIAKGYAEIIQTRFPVPDEEKALVKGLNDGLSQLGKIVEDLLTISSIESGYQLTLENTSLSEIINPLVKEANDLAVTRNNKFTIKFHSGEVNLRADVERLRGALRNVISNALKFTENGSIELVTNKIENKLIISISDNGIGIEPSELSKLFNKFHRAANALDGDYEGKGIGLYLTKLIVEEHGGKINVVSQIKQGSTLTIELPCR